MEALRVLLEECRKLDYSLATHHTSFYAAVADMQASGIEAATFPIAPRDWRNADLTDLGVGGEYVSLARYSDFAIFEADREVVVKVGAPAQMVAIAWPAGVPLPVAWMPEFYLRGPPSMGKWVYLGNSPSREGLRDRLSDLACQVAEGPGRTNT